MTQVISGALDPEFAPAPEGTYEATIVASEIVASQKGDSLNHNITIRPTAQALETLNRRRKQRKQEPVDARLRYTARGRINFKHEWMTPDFMNRAITTTKTYNGLKDGFQETDASTKFKAENLELIRAGISLPQLNRTAAYMDGVVSGPDENNQRIFDVTRYEENASDLVGRTVRVSTQHLDVNNLTRRKAAKLESEFDEETVRAEATIQYPTGWFRRT